MYTVSYSVKYGLIELISRQCRCQFRLPGHVMETRVEERFEAFLTMSHVNFPKEKSLLNHVMNSSVVLDKKIGMDGWKTDKYSS